MPKTAYEQIRFDLIDLYNHSINTDHFSQGIDDVLVKYNKALRQRVSIWQTHDDCSDLEHLLELK
jgi:hypothetical protein